MKKNDFGYPNGEKQVSLMITRKDPVGRKPEWKEYQPNDADALSLRVTVEVKGSMYLPFEGFESLAKRDAAWKALDRAESWRSALTFAEHLWKIAPHRDYIVIYKPQDADNQHGKEAVYIYQRIPPLEELGAKEGATKE